MTWQQIVLIGLFFLNTLITIAYVGKRRDVVTPGAAAIVAVLNTLLILMVVSIPVDA